MRRLLDRHLAGDVFARIAVGALFTLLSMNLLADVSRTHRLTSFLLLASESLVVALTIVRRSARIVDRSPMATIVTVVSLIGPPLLRASPVSSAVPDLVTGLASAIGLAVVLAGKVTLGRSFGITPANRGVVVGGPYGIVRHPIYAGYVLTHLGFVIANPTRWNAMLLLVADTALVIRALREERVLAGDRHYQTYCRRVTWHLVPGLF